MSISYCFFFCNDTATTESYTYRPTLSPHDALPIFMQRPFRRHVVTVPLLSNPAAAAGWHEKQQGSAFHERQVQRPRNRGPRKRGPRRSEEHTSELSH